MSSNREVLLHSLRESALQIRRDVWRALHASGISLGVSGGTHHSLEDLALMRSLPGMTVIVPADAHQAWHATHATDDIDGPVYIRLGGRVAEPPVTPADAVMQVGTADRLRDGDDVTVVACGCLVAPAMAAADALAEQGLGVRVLNMHTIKPLDRDAILAAANETRGIVTAEEHHVAGGLGGAVAELLAQTRPTPMRLVGMPDEFAIVGPTPQVRARYGMSTDGIREACLELVG